MKMERRIDKPIPGKEAAKGEDFSGMEMPELMETLEESMGKVSAAFEEVRAVTDELKVRISEQEEAGPPEKKPEPAALEQEIDEVELDRKTRAYAKRHNVGYGVALEAVTEREIRA